MSLAASILEGNRLALARMLTQVENGTNEGEKGLNELFPFSGKAHLVGITGAPGTGKSSLVNQLALFFRRPPQGKLAYRVAIVAVDPSSPFTGGAILGDRVRMRDLAGDPGVFIRSMASRGTLGGLAATTAGLVQVLDAAGFDIIFIETVGAGQSEVDIARLAHTTLVIEAPGFGDDIQAIKAGILEIADILVINKADRPMVEITERALRSMLDMAYPADFSNHHGQSQNFPQRTVEFDGSRWIPPVLRSVAIEGTGIDVVGEQILNHHAYLKSTGKWEQRERYRLSSELDSLIRATLVNRWRETISDVQYQRALDDLIDRKLSPRQAATLLIDGRVG